MREWFARPLLAVVLAMTLVFSPLTAPVSAQGQDPAQNPPPAPPQNPTPQAAPTPLAPPIPVSLGMSKHNYSKGPDVFPNLLNAYRPIHVEQPVLVNSPRLEQMIRDGKLQLTLQDAVELALENSLDIAVQRYLPWFADTDILKARSGSFGR